LSRLFPATFDTKSWYDALYALADSESENAYIQCVHAIELLQVLVGMSDEGFDAAEKLVVSW
jgi:hypothetical protein